MSPASINITRSIKLSEISGARITGEIQQEISVIENQRERVSLMMAKKCQQYRQRTKIMAKGNRSWEWNYFRRAHYGKIQQEIPAYTNKGKRLVRDGKKSVNSTDKGQK